MRERIGPVMLATMVAAFVVSGAGAPRSRAQDGNPPLSYRAAIPYVARDVEPDLAVEGITFVEASESSVTISYRLKNVGLAKVTLAPFTVRAWFSTDGRLDRGANLEAGIQGSTAILEGGEAFELSMTAANGDATWAAYPYLMIEVDSGGTVKETSLANNVHGIRRPPPALITDIVLSWDVLASTATISWTFNGEAFGFEDRGFRIEIPEFGTQIVPPGTRSITVAFDVQSGKRPCEAHVAAVGPDDVALPAARGGNICGA
jgi:hypothetical protein